MKHGEENHNVGGCNQIDVLDALVEETNFQSLLSCDMLNDCVVGAIHPPLDNKESSDGLPICNDNDFTSHVVDDRE